MRYGTRADADEDGVPDSEDNHPCIFNDDQALIANDTAGDSCLDGNALVAAIA